MLTDRQTERQTNKRRELHNLIGRRNYWIAAKCKLCEDYKDLLATNRYSNCPDLQLSLFLSSNTIASKVRQYCTFEALIIMNSDVRLHNTLHLIRSCLDRVRRIGRSLVSIVFCEPLTHVDHSRCNLPCCCLVSSSASASRQCPSELALNFVTSTPAETERSLS